MVSLATIVGVIPDYCITGSTAIYMLLEGIDTPKARDLMAFVKPNDIDVVIPEEQPRLRRLEGVDVTVLKGLKTVMVNSYCVHEPNQLLRIYREYLGDIGREEKIEADKKKIDALAYICSVFATRSEVTEPTGCAMRLEF